ncbi:hypothetical protein [Ureaplasma diversum]|uniref:Uncharacterized protein n=1 Tax=Ureaplasma diversum NCTC 246 TaxID=1188241 RepID=A0A084F1C1_9BACT|nr:hypothetical protein [Ureaplasma diversum]KEZ24013.1 Hypothetical protein, predicted lipoprotein [Ureaplasma diversum NCTC 246]
MSKFKNKKALALSVGAIMAGGSVIGIVAACAPTKAKPNKPTEKKVEQPQTGGNQSSNPGSGSTIAGSKQGSETGGSTNTNPETGSTTNTTKQGSENSGTTNSSGGSTNTNPNNSGSENGGSTTEASPKNEATPPTDSTTTTKPKNDTKENNPSLGSQDGSSTDNKEKQNTPNQGSGGSSNPTEETRKDNPSENSDPKDGMSSQNKSEKDDKPEVDKGSNMQSDDTNANGKETPMTKPAPTASLAEDAMLVKVEDKYQLVLNVTNADGKFIEVELRKKDASEEEVKKSTKVKVTSDKVTVDFTSLEPSTKYKISSIKFYESDEAQEATNIVLDNDLTTKELVTEAQKEIKQPEFNKDKMVVTAFEYEKGGNDKYYLALTLKANKELFDKIKQKHLRLELKNGNLYQYDETKTSNLLPRWISEKNGEVTFKIFPSYPWGKVNFTINKIWEYDKKEENNLLATPFEIINKEEN